MDASGLTRDRPATPMSNLPRATDSDEVPNMFLPCTSSPQRTIYTMIQPSLLTPKLILFSPRVIMHPSSPPSLTLPLTLPLSLPSPRQWMRLMSPGGWTTTRHLPLTKLPPRYPLIPRPMIFTLSNRFPRWSSSTLRI